MASNVTDSNEYVTNQEELLALTRVDFDKARPLIDRLNLDSSLKTSRVLAKWALYRHALDTDSIGDIDQYRDELKAIVEDKSALPGMRDLAMDALVGEKEWSGATTGTSRCWATKRLRPARERHIVHRTDHI